LAQAECANAVHAMDWANYGADEEEGYQVVPPPESRQSRQDYAGGDNQPWWAAQAGGASSSSRRPVSGSRQQGYEEAVHAEEHSSADSVETQSQGSNNAADETVRARLLSGAQSTRQSRDRQAQRETHPVQTGARYEHAGGVGPINDSYDAEVRPRPFGNGTQPSPSHAEGRQTVPSGAAFLGVERTILLMSEADSDVLIQDGLGGEVVLPVATEKGFKVALAAGRLTWRSAAVGEDRTAQVTSNEVNWIVANRSIDGRSISWLCYKEPLLRSLPSEAVLVGSTTSQIGSRNSPLIVKDGYGGEVRLSSGSETAFEVSLDPRGCFHWRYDWVEGVTEPDVSDVRWIKAQRSADGQQVLWQFFAMGAPARRGEVPATARAVSGAPTEATQPLPETPVSQPPKSRKPAGDVPPSQRKVPMMAPSMSTMTSKPLGRIFGCCLRWPAVVGMLTITILLVLTAVLYPGMEVETDFDSFLEASSTVNDQWNAFLAALPARSTSGESGRRLKGEFAGARKGRRLEIQIDPNALHTITILNIIYTDGAGGNILNERALKDIQEFELRLRSGPYWRRMCHEIVHPGAADLCDPGISVVNYLYPTSHNPVAPFQEEVSSRYNLSGESSEPLPLEAVPYVVGNTGNTDVLFPLDYPGHGPVSKVRSRFEFNMYCCDRWSSSAERSQIVPKLKEQYEEFVEQELFPELQRKFDEEGKTFELAWYGDVIEEHEVWIALMKDIKLAIGSATFIFVYLALHTRSPLLSLSAVFLTILAIPTAFVTSAVVAGANRVTGASFLSLFLIIGLGADDALVFASFWKSSAEAVGKDDYPRRLHYVYSHAAMATLVTSVTTAASFFANLASVLLPLREFGFFMGMCVMWAYAYILIGFPGALVLNERLSNRIGRCAAYCQRGRVADAVKKSPSMRRGQQFLGIRAGFHRGLDAFLDRVLVPYAGLVLASSVIITIIMLTWTVTQVEVDGAMPNIFPEGHNQYVVADLKEGYESITAHYPPMSFDICYVSRYPPTYSEALSCELNWCLMGSDTEITYHGDSTSENSTTCACRITEEPASNCIVKTSQGGPAVNSLLSVRFVGIEPDDFPEGFFSSTTWNEHVQAAMDEAHGRPMRFTKSGASDPQYSATYVELSRLVQQHWESGQVRTMPYSMSPVHSLELEDVSQGQSYCNVHQVCYCGAPSCTMREESPLELTEANQMLGMLEIPRPSSARRLQANPSWSLERQFFPSPPLARGRRLVSGYADVALVWGIHVPSGKPLLGNADDSELWDYDTQFVASSTASQRLLLATCRHIEENREMLNLERSNCWMEQFRDWVRTRNPPELFPVRSHEFNTLLQIWAEGSMLPSGVPVKDFMWLDGNSDLIATYFRFDLTLNYAQTDAGVALSEKDKWDGVVAHLLAQAPPDADGFFHTSRLWIRASAEQAIIDGTVATMVLSITCGFLGTLAFTRNIVISIFVIISVTGVTTALAFFMVVLMNWAVGVIEVLGLIVFVGYSITYSLHIAHRYGESEREHFGKRDSVRREEAVRSSLQVMTSAVLGSAVTTLGSSFFLFFTTLVIFYKLASVLFAVTFFAAAFALIALPSALLVAGPLGLCGCGCILDRLPTNSQQALTDEEYDEAEFGEQMSSVTSQVYIAQSRNQGTPSPRARVSTDGTGPSSRSPSLFSAMPPNRSAAEHYTGNTMASSSIASAVALAASPSPYPAQRPSAGQPGRNRPPPLNSLSSVPAVGQPGVLGRAENGAPLESVLPEANSNYSPMITPLAAGGGGRQVSSASTSAQRTRTPAPRMATPSTRLSVGKSKPIASE